MNLADFYLETAKSFLQGSLVEDCPILEITQPSKQFSKLLKYAEDTRGKDVEFVYLILERTDFNFIPTKGYDNLKVVRQLLEFETKQTAFVERFDINQHDLNDALDWLVDTDISDLCFTPKQHYMLSIVREFYRYFLIDHVSQEALLERLLTFPRIDQSVILRYRSRLEQYDLSFEKDSSDLMYIIEQAQTIASQRLEGPVFDCEIYVFPVKKLTLKNLGGKLCQHLTPNLNGCNDFNYHDEYDIINNELIQMLNSQKFARFPNQRDCPCLQKPTCKYKLCVDNINVDVRHYILNHSIGVKDYKCLHCSIKYDTLLDFLNHDCKEDCVDYKQLFFRPNYDQKYSDLEFIKKVGLFFGLKSTEFQVLKTVESPEGIDSNAGNGQTYCCPVCDVVTIDFLKHIGDHFETNRIVENQFDFFEAELKCPLCFVKMPLFELVFQHMPFKCDIRGLNLTKLKFNTNYERELSLFLEKYFGLFVTSFADKDSDIDIRVLKPWIVDGMRYKMFDIVTCDSCPYTSFRYLFLLNHSVHHSSSGDDVSFILEESNSRKFQTFGNHNISLSHFTNDIEPTEKAINAELEKMYCCGRCPVRTRKQIDILHHVSNCEKDEHDKAICIICQEVFLPAFLLSHHMSLCIKAHLSCFSNRLPYKQRKKPNMCHYCARTFRFESDRKYHEAVDHSGTFSCCKCDEGFENKLQLFLHLIYSENASTCIKEYDAEELDWMIDI